MGGWHIVWHHRDLRIEDNPALSAAAEAGRVLPLYIHGPKEEGRWSPGAASNWWLHHSLNDLSERYRKLGSRLLIREGPALKVLEDLGQEIPIEAVYWNNRYEPALRKRDRQVGAALEKQGSSVHQFEGNYLITPEEIRNKTGKPYSVFTPFSKTVLDLRLWRSPIAAPKISNTHRLKSEKVVGLNLLPKQNWTGPFSKQWFPGRGGAITSLKRFIQEVDKYEEQRNIPSICGTSRLSPHLHFGEISPHEIWSQLEHKSKDSMPFLRQLIWREFGNYFLFHSPTATDFSWKQKFDDFPWKKNRQALRAWQEGRTGYPIVDAGMRELWKTGWMHNRVRMIVGSFLVKDLFFHWTEGARWFWDTLIDADLANNTLGWQWIAGSGPDAAPYFRIFNPVLQSKKFDPDGTYIRKWIPELGTVSDKWIHNPWESPERSTLYPSPIVNHAKARVAALAAYKNL